MKRKEQVEVLKRYLAGKGHEIKSAAIGERFDFWVGDKRVCVKVANKQVQNNLWSFKIGKSSTRMDADFFICITALDDVFVIPAERIPAHFIKIRFAYPSLTKPKFHKWQLYLDKFDFGT